MAEGTRALDCEDEVAGRLVSILAAIKKLPRDAVEGAVAADDFLHALGMDSIDAVELTVQLDMVFELGFGQDPDDLDRLASFESLVDLVVERGRLGTVRDDDDESVHGPERPFETTGRDRPAPRTLLAAVDRAARAHPHKAALHDSRRSVTFAELRHLSDRAARNLWRRGVRKGDRVAIAADKSVETVAAMLGILRCGAAFVPLDPAAPEARLVALVTDAAPAATVGRLPGPPPSDAVHVPIDDVFPDDSTADVVLPDVDPDDIAYCMYTSGSSGLPKGVQIDHAAIVAFITAVHGRMTVDADSRCLNTSPFFFDVSVVDVWYPLAMGATVHLSDRFLVPDRVLDTIERERITHFSAVGSILTLLRRAGRKIGDRDLTSVTRVMSGAEIIDPATVREWLAAVPDAIIFNGYGPTEATCCCFAYPITRANADRVPYPIGVPFPGTDVLVVGPDGEICRAGTVGELLLAGPQVARGYLGRPDEDRRRFVVRDGHRWYRTGDLVLQDDTGEFHFRGRRDHELKIRGFRIHPAEITTALQQCEGVAEAHVTTTIDERGQRALAAAVVPVDGAPLDPGSLRTQLRKTLPEYMVPGALLVVDALPKLPSGKVDDGALSAGLAPAGAGADGGKEPGS